jgi:hypothetical protein
VQVRIRRAFIASGTEVLSSTQIYDWTHSRRRQSRRKKLLGSQPGRNPWRLRYIAGTAWSAKWYMNMRPLYQQLAQTGAAAA